MFKWLKSFNLDENNLRNFLEKAKSVGDIASQIAEVDAQIEALMKKKESLAAARAEAEKEILSFDHSKLFAQTVAEASPEASEEVRESAAENLPAEEKPAEAPAPAPKRAVAISVPEFLAPAATAAAKEGPPAVSEEVRESAAVSVAETASEHDFVTTPAAFFATRRTLRTSTAQQGGEAHSQNAPVSMSEFLNS